MIHRLKIAPQFFLDVASGRKGFECRVDDRGFRVGDTLILEEWTHAKGYTGRTTTKKVTYILNGGWFGILSGNVVMSLADV